MAYYTMGDHVTAFCRHCTQTIGRWGGQPLELEPWQKELVDEMFLVDEDGHRVYSTVLIGEPRKNGKSSLAAALGLYFLAMDGENQPEIVLAAASRDQANIVFRQAKGYVEESEALLDLIDPHKYAIECPDNRGLLKSLSADGKLQHGLNPYCVIVDELHAWTTAKTQELWDALTTGSIARQEPMTICITTAGFDKETILGKFYDRALTLEDVEHRPGLVIAKDRRNGFLMWWYSAPEGCDLEDEDAWMLANPASWVTPEVLRKQLNSPGMTENKFRRLHLNQWTANEEIWIPPQDWAACANPMLDFAEGEPVWVGIDMASKHDSAAVAIAAPSGDGYKVWAEIFQPDRPTEMVIRAEQYILEVLRDRYRIMEIAYDPYMLDRSSIIFTDAGLDCTEYPQTDSYMAPASQLVYDLVREGKLEHPNLEALNEQVLAAVAVPTERGAFRIKKSKSKRKIDAAVAMAIAVSRAHAAANQPSFFLY